MSSLAFVKFETGDLSECKSSANAGVTTSPVHRGSYAGKMSRVNSVANIEIGASASTYYNATTAYYTFYWQSLSHSGEWALCNFEDTAGAGKCFLHIDDTGNLILQDINGTVVANYGTDGGAYADGLWVQMQVQVGTGASTTVEIRVNGSHVHTASNVNTGSTANGGIKFGGNSMYTSTFVVDDVQVDNAAYPPLLSQYSETLGLSDSQSTIKAAGSALSRVVSDNLGVAEARTVWVRGPTLMQTGVANSFGLGDVLSRSGVSKRLVTDNVGAGDRQSVSGPVYRLLLIDNLGAVEIGLIPSDYLLLEDGTPLLLEDGTPLLLESAGTSAASVMVLTRTFRAISDSTGISDLAKRAALSWQRLTQENTGISDVLSRRGTTLRAVLENLGLVDVFARALPTVSPAPASEKLGLSDLVIASKLWLPLVQDNLGASDSGWSRLANASRVVAENLGVAEQVLRLAKAIRTLTDNLGLADSLVAFGGRPIFLSDGLGASDTPNTAPHYWVRLFSEILGVTDSASTTPFQRRSVAIADNIGAAEAILRTGSSLRLLQDLLAIFAEPSSPGAMAWIRLLQESLALTDLPLLLATTSRKTTDGAGLTESLKFSLISLRLVSDLLGLADAIYALNASRAIPNALVARWSSPQPAVGQDWWLVRGNDQPYLFVPDQGPTNIAAWTIEWQLRATDGDSTILLSHDTVGGGLAVVDAANGLVQLTLGATDTLSLLLQTAPFYWELRRTDFGAEATLARGTLVLQKELAFG